MSHFPLLPPPSTFLRSSIVFPSHRSFDFYLSFPFFNPLHRDDVRLMWDNCRTYNRIGTAPRCAGDTLSEQFERKWAMSMIEEMLAVRDAQDFIAEVRECSSHSDALFVLTDSSREEAERVGDQGIKLQLEKRPQRVKLQFTMGAAGRGARAQLGPYSSRDGFEAQSRCKLRLARPFPPFFA